MRVPIACASLLLTGLIGFAAPLQARPFIVDHHAGVSNIVQVQGWRERCRYLRHRARELRSRIAYAPPWEQRRLERRLWQTRHEMRDMRC